MDDRSVPLIEPGGVLFHIGVHKTGTTALQESLRDARERLAEQGVLYPDSTQSHYLHGLAAIGQRRGPSVPPAALWKRLVAQVAGAGDMRTIVSGESFCEATDEQARDIVEALGGERVTVVMTVRPLEQLLPSTWQQHVKAGLSLPYRAWLDDVERGPVADRETPNLFWVRNDHARQVAKWSAATATDRVRVVVVDTRQKMKLFEDFEDMLGLERSTLRIAENAASNRSLSAEEVEVVRLLNERVGNHSDYHQYDRIVRRAGVSRMVERRRPGSFETALVVPAATARILREHGRATVESIRASGVQVVGDLDLLVPDSPLDETAEVADATLIPIEAVSILLEGIVEKSFAELTAAQQRGAGRLQTHPSTLYRSLRRTGGRVLRRLGLRR